MTTGGCHLDRPAPPVTIPASQSRFVAIGSPALLPGWASDDHASALAAFFVSARHLTSADAPDCRLWQQEVEGLSRAIGDAAAARSLLESRLVAWEVEPAGPPQPLDRLLTGYFEPVVSASRQSSASFPVPLYRRPADLVGLVDDRLRGALGDGLTYARQTDAGLVPYYERREIEAGALGGLGLEIAFVRDRVEAFVIHVQGSATLVLDTGEELRLAYDGKNGLPYTSIGRHLIDSGLVPAEDMSLARMEAWLRANPAVADQVMQRNRSFVFFKELAAGEGPFGAEGIVLQPGRSLAVDAGVHRLGTPVYVSSPTLRHAGDGNGFHRLMTAHDVGSGVRGAARGDIYFGSGEDAGMRAGMTRHTARFFVLLPKGVDPNRTAS